MSAPYYWHNPRLALEAHMGLDVVQRGVLDAAIVYCVERRSWRLPEDPAKAIGVTRAQWERLRRSTVFARMYDAEANELCVDFARFGPVGRSPLSAEQRRRVLERDGEVCAYCGDTDGPFEIDHVHPVAKGGQDDDDNLTVACKPCNRSKRDKTLEEWGRHVR